MRRFAAILLLCLSSAPLTAVDRNPRPWKLAELKPTPIRTFGNHEELLQQIWQGTELGGKRAGSFSREKRTSQACGRWAITPLLSQFLSQVPATCLIRNDLPVANANSIEQSPGDNVMSPTTVRSLRAACLLVAGVVAPLASGCQRLNLWDGPHYRDDPVISQVSPESPLVPGDLDKTPGSH